MSIQELKKELSIETVLAHFGLVMDKQNRVKCPFHHDKTPSLQIYPKSNSYCCFSTKCTAGTGDQLQLLELLLGKSKHESLVLAHELLGVPYQKKNESEDLSAIYEKLLKSFKRSSKAKAYAESRHLDSSFLELGYNGGSYGKLKYCLVFGLKNEKGEVVDLYGRSIYGEVANRHFYRGGTIKGLYPHYPNPETKRLIMTESVIDAASLYQEEKIRTACEILALYGGNGFTEEHERSIKSLKKLEEIILMLDGDEGGRKGIDVLSKKLMSIRSDIKISYVEMLEGEDVNSLLENHKSEIYEHLLANRKELNFSFSTEKTTEKEKLKKGKLDVSNPSYLVYDYEPLRYTLLGGVNVKELDKLRVTIKIELLGEQSSFYSLRHNLDLYNDDQLTKLVRKASERLEVSSRNLQHGLSGLIDGVEKWRSENRVGEEVKLAKRVLTAERIKAAKAYLKRSKLLRRTSDDIGKSGIIGEYKNRMIVYLSFTSRLRAMPLHVITFGPSGSGKTYVIEKVSELMPEEDVLQFTALTENALYYLNGGDVSGKILICEDLDGAESNMYNMRELLSKREISKLVTTKDSKGKLDTVRMHLRGPVALGSTTTRDRLYEDNANRALLISPDSSQDQSERIQAYQRQVSSGKVNKQSERKWKEFFKDIQSILQPITVRNPYAEDLRIPSSCFKPLRTNAHYLHFIETITFYHQYQRERKICPITKTEYIETSLEDIEAANALLEEVLLIKADDLRSKQCRAFYNRLKHWLGETQASSFKSGELVKALRVPSRTVNYNLNQLRQYGYLKVLGGNRYRGGLEYELARVGDYERLSEGVKSSLSNVLESLRGKMSEQVSNQ